METALRFAELVATAQNAGFDVLDARGLPVTATMYEALEDDNLMEEPAHVVFHEAEMAGERGAVADVQVGQQVFQIHGDWSRAGELRLALTGQTDSRRETWQ
jgi:hypothetical protein